MWLPSSSLWWMLPSPLPPMLPPMLPSMLPPTLRRVLSPPLWRMLPPPLRWLGYRSRRQGPLEGKMRTKQPIRAALVISNINIIKAGRISYFSFLHISVLY